MGCGVLTYGLFMAVLRKGFESAETAGWIQAVGTIATIATALVIWIGDRRERRQERRAIALVASVRMSGDAATFRHEVTACAHLLDLAEEFAYPRDPVSEIFSRMNAFPRWTVEEINRLSPLGDCAMNLARSLHTAHAALDVLAATLNHDRFDDLDFKYPHMRQVIGQLKNAERNVDLAVREMGRAGKPEALA